VEVVSILIATYAGSYRVSTSPLVYPEVYYGSYLTPGSSVYLSQQF